MEIVSYQKYLRTSTKKTKGLGKAIVGLLAYDALDRLALVSEKGAKVISKALKSALSNAKNNNKVDDKLLTVKAVEILKGPFFKRWQPVSKGMAHSIKKRTTHIKIILVSKKEEKVSKVTELPKKEEKKEEKHGT